MIDSIGRYVQPDSTRDLFIKGPVTTKADLLPKEVRFNVKVKDLRVRRVFSPDTNIVNNVDGRFGYDDNGDVINGCESRSGNVIKVDGGGGGVGLICDDDVNKEGEVDVCKKIDGGDDDASKGGEVGDSDVMR
ncbi:hypothetical protein Tco_0401821 [Tanacetum coccineum]